MFTVDPTMIRDEGLSHLGTPNGYARRVPRSRYSPPSEEVAARIGKVVELYRQQQQIWDAYKRALAEVTDREKDNVPIAHMADQLNIERKTVYRHLGRSMT